MKNFELGDVVQTDEGKIGVLDYLSDDEEWYVKIGHKIELWKEEGLNKVEQETCFIGNGFNAHFGASFIDGPENIANEKDETVLHRKCGIKMDNPKHKYKVGDLMQFDQDERAKTWTITNLTTSEIGDPTYTICGEVGFFGFTHTGVPEHTLAPIDIKPGDWVTLEKSPHLGALKVIKVGEPKLDYIVVEVWNAVYSWQICVNKAFCKKVERVDFSTPGNSDIKRGDWVEIIDAPKELKQAFKVDDILLRIGPSNCPQAKLLSNDIPGGFSWVDLNRLKKVDPPAPEIKPGDWVEYENEKYIVVDILYNRWLMVIPANGNSLFGRMFFRNDVKKVSPPEPKPEIKEGDEVWVKGTVINPTDDDGDMFISFENTTPVSNYAYVAASKVKKVDPPKSGLKPGDNVWVKGTVISHTDDDGDMFISFKNAAPVSNYAYVAASKVKKVDE
jgi:hypothetical protein